MAPEDKVLPIAPERASLADEGMVLPAGTQTAAGWEFAQASALRIGSILFMLLVWWAMTLFFPPTLIPHPLDTLREVVAIIGGGDFFSEMGVTLRRVGVGFGIAMLVSIPLGILMGTVKPLEHFFEPPVILGLPEYAPPPQWNLFVPASSRWLSRV